MPCESEYQIRYDATQPYDLGCVFMIQDKFWILVKCVYTPQLGSICFNRWELHLVKMTLEEETVYSIMRS